MDTMALLTEFISIPVSGADGVFEKFEALPGALSAKGSAPLERFVYIPGSRKDRVLLVAHGDTVWDQAYGNPKQTTPILENGIFRSSNPECGIGADDRAGCAMVWALKDSGHSLLIVDGEEKGKKGANFLRKEHPKLYKELNGHRFMMEMDWAGTGGCLYNQVDNTRRFKAYITEKLGFTDSKAKGGCDLQILCHKICGVNVSTGWHNCHRPTETLDCAQWEASYQALSQFLQPEQPRFSIPVWSRCKRFLGKVKGKLAAMLRKMKLLPGKKKT